MDKYGKLIANDSLQFERLLPGPIERIWDYLIDENKRKLWFCGGTSSTEPGGEITFEFNNSQLGEPKELTPEKYKDQGDGFISKAIVLESHEPHKLVIEWEGIVTFKLEEQGDEVLLTLTHEKLPDIKETKVGILAGWHTHLDILREHLDDKTPKGFWSAHMLREEEYSKRV